MTPMQASGIQRQPSCRCQPASAQAAMPASNNAIRILTIICLDRVMVLSLAIISSYFEVRTGCSLVLYHYGWVTFSQSISIINRFETREGSFWLWLPQARNNTIMWLYQYLVALRQTRGGNSYDGRCSWRTHDRCLCS